MLSRTIKQTHAGERWIIDRWDDQRGAWIARYAYKRQDEAEAEYEGLAALGGPVRLRLVEL